MKPSITESAVFSALGDFLSQNFGIAVVIGQINNVPPPASPFIVMTPILRKRLSTNTHEWSGEVPIGEFHSTTPTEIHIQLDFYGDGAGDYIQAFYTIFQDYVGFDSFPKGIKPLYATEPRETPFIFAEKNYTERWQTDVAIQFNPTVTTPVVLIDRVTVTPINVT